MKEIVLKKEPTRKEGGSSFFSKCLDQALVYLGIREHNRFELSVKLKAKGYEKDVIGKVLDSLEEDGSLSEERYVRSFVRSSNRRHPEGKSLILRRLAAKGADRNVAEQVVCEIYTDSYTAELAEQARAQIVKKGRAKTEDEIRFEMAKLGFRVS